MHQAARTRTWWGLVVLIAAFANSGCGDDVPITTETGTETGSSSGSTTTTTTTTEPTTTEPTTTGPTTGTTATGTDSSTTVTTTGPTTGSTTDATTGTSSTTDTTTGNELLGKSVSQTVNGGAVATSPNFRMVFTLGQPTQNQGTYTSTSFRLQGGLVGANGSPP